MQGMKNILEFEARQARQEPPAAQPVLPPQINSQYELLKFLLTIDENFGREMLNAQLFKHPLALDVQKALFTNQPGVLDLMVSVTSNRAHPLYWLEEFRSVADLIDNQFPTVIKTTNDVLWWGRQLGVELQRCFQSALLSPSYSPERVFQNICKTDLFPGINTNVYSPCAIRAAREMKIRPSPYRIGNEIYNLGGILVHGEVTAERMKYITEVATAHKYFLGRKITILKNLESNNKFTVGIFNVMTRIKDQPFMCIGYRINDEDHLNIPEVGIKFEDISPVICLDKNCDQGDHCVNNVSQNRYIYINTGSVELGDPPMAAKNTVDFDAMQQAWVDNAIKNNITAPYLLDQLAIDDERRLKFRKIKGTDCGYRTIWGENYLSFVAEEFKEKSREDDLLLKEHFIPPPGENETDPDLQIRLDDVAAAASTLFMPKLYQKL